MHISTSPVSSPQFMVFYLKVLSTERSQTSGVAIFKVIPSKKIMERCPEDRLDTMSLPELHRKAAQVCFRKPQSLAGHDYQSRADSSRASATSQSSVSSEIARASANPNGPGNADRWAKSAATRTSTVHSSIPSTSRPAHPVFSHVTRTSDPRGQSGVIVALAEGRGNAHGEVGLAAIDLRTSVVSLGQYADTASYMKTICKVNVLEPSVVVVPETMASLQHPQPIYIILKEFNSHGGPNIVSVQRKCYNESTGIDLVKKLSLNSCGKLEADLASKYYCLAAFAALVSYVEFERKVVMVHKTLKIDYMHMEDTCLIDCSTAKSLELISNACDPQQVKQCLFGVLDQTKTYAGGRLLRANLLQPFTKLETINMRLDCIAELIRSEDLFFGLQQILSRFTDVEKTITFLVQLPQKESAKISETHIGSFIHLKHILGLVTPLRECMESSQNALFRGFYDVLNDGRYGEMSKIIDVLVHPETKFEKGSLRMKTQKCYAVRPKINGCLDVARLLYSESVDDISALVAKLQERYNLPLQTGYDALRGFHMQLSTSEKNPINLAELPQDFIHVTKSRNTIYFTTKDLINLNGRSLECVREVFVLSHEMLKRACESLRPLIGCLYELAECVATVDVLVSLTAACSLGDYNRPMFHEMLVLERSRHPILDRLMTEPPIANNAYSDEGCNFVILTGPNMAGKTTYVKQIALLQIMAQIGSFVPADFACFRVFEQIFSRFGSGDDIQSNASTFMMEMRDMQHICTHANLNTLVMIDELGRGTSPEEGVGICWALCEELLLTKATTFFVTHFEEICDLQHLYPGIHNVHFRTVTKKSSENIVEVLEHTHELVDGCNLDVRYGLAAAEATSLPSEIISDAAEMLKKIRKIRFTMGEDEAEFQEQQTTCRYASRLVQLANNKNLPYDEIEALLLRIRDEHSAEIAQLRKSLSEEEDQSLEENPTEDPDGIVIDDTEKDSVQVS